MARTARRIRSAGDSASDTSERASGRRGEVSAGVVDLVKATAVSLLSGVREVGAELGNVGVAAVRGGIRAAGEIGADVGRLAVDAAEGAVSAADRITAAAGRAANNLVGTTINGMSGIVRGSIGGARAASGPTPGARRPLARAQSRAQSGARTRSRRRSSAA